MPTQPSRRYPVPTATLLTCLLLGLTTPHFTTAQINNDVCNCYCCPNTMSPPGVSPTIAEACSKVKSKDDLPLAGTVSISGAAFRISCTVGACYSYFPTACPLYLEPDVNSMFTANNVRAGCASCPGGLDGKASNGSVTQPTASTPTPTGGATPTSGSGNGGGRAVQ
ncbi:hypothetical protein HK102_006983, partial [Quaeritorhiza haematococci]